MFQGVNARNNVHVTVNSAFRQYTVMEHQHKANTVPNLLTVR